MNFLMQHFEQLMNYVAQKGFNYSTIIGTSKLYLELRKSELTYSLELDRATLKILCLERVYQKQVKKLMKKDSKPHIKVVDFKSFVYLEILRINNKDQ